MPRVLLTVAYDGTEYAGWQRQENAIAVQEVLEEALGRLLGCEVKVAGASRTDAGVHALGQQAAFSASSSHMQIPLEKLPQVLNGFLPSDITVSGARVVDDDFNPRFSALHKTYCYQIYNAAVPNPLVRRYSAFVARELDFGLMQEAAGYFVGKHDFKAFCASGSSAKTTVRTVFSCGMERDGGLIKMRICGDAFLYNMVRIIAGTLVYVGIGKISAEDIPSVIRSSERERAGKTMPPEGLCLEWVQLI